MKKLLSLPPNLVDCFHDIEQADRKEWFCTSDPVGCKLGSGGGTTWLLQAAMQEDLKDAADAAASTASNVSADSQISTDAKTAEAAWLSKEKRILLHAGGQSRRLPSYAPSGKILTPIPVFRWQRGQKLSQTLLSLQLPLYEEIMNKAPESLHTLIASGDIYIRAEEPLQAIPEADVVCYGLWVDPNLAKNHGVFVMDRKSPEKLDFMLQKPSVEKLGELMQNYLFLMDIGVWLLSDRAVELIMKRSMKRTADGGAEIGYYDMYSEFGPSLGAHPAIEDDELNQLSVAILPLPGGQFYHYGTSREMISSTLAVQNLVVDQREISLNKVKPHPAMFTQNSVIQIELKPENSNLWVENSCVGKQWSLANKNIITGVPMNDWALRLAEGVCLDVEPIGENEYVARPYGFNDAFKGALADEAVLYQGRPMGIWLTERGLTAEDIEGNHDLQAARIFPVSGNLEELGKMIAWMVQGPVDVAASQCGCGSQDAAGSQNASASPFGADLQQCEARDLWLKARKLSADEISTFANLRRLVAQRKQFRKANWIGLAANHKRSVFYQLNLQHAAEEFVAQDIELPRPLTEEDQLIKRIGDAMFRSRVHGLRGQQAESAQEEAKAFGLMREGLIASERHRQMPQLSVYSDQIVWGRSPVRIDLAGGWTDTPPYCLREGGNVINLSVTLNGQPPLQVYVKPSAEKKIILRSIDLGAAEVISTFEELRQFNVVGSPFSIPKAALTLAGFHPDFCKEQYRSLQEQLTAFGAGIEVTLLSAIPAGSGLGTSSILASTVLGAVSEFCGLHWDKQEIGSRTLVLEQLLTTGGGWQDQFGGILPGVKLLQTDPGWKQSPMVRWLPDYLFTDSQYKKCHLLYYTGITRTAKGILAEIVKGMFLNNTQHLDLLRQMKQHTLDMYDAIQRNHYEEVARLVGETWKQNKLLDSGTNPAAVQQIINQIDDLCLGYKLPGAGGGGFLYMAAKDEEAAARIRQILNENRPNDKARFVEMALSTTGLETSLS